MPKVQVETGGDDAAKTIKGMNETLLNLPNLPSFGNHMDKTVRFSNKKRLFRGSEKNEDVLNTAKSRNGKEKVKRFLQANAEEPADEMERATQRDSTLTGFVSPCGARPLYDRPAKTLDLGDSAEDFEPASTSLHIINQTPLKPIKCSSELKKNMQTLVTYSTKFKTRRLNNYDNQIRNG